MTSGVPTPTQTSPPQQPAAPAAATAASPPNKRDLKSWWKGFKLPSKHQETSGRVPFSYGFRGALPPSSKQRGPRMVVSLFREHEHYEAGQIPKSLLAQHDQHVVAIIPTKPPALPAVAPSDATGETPKGRSIGLLSKRIASCFGSALGTDSPKSPPRPASRTPARGVAKGKTAGSKPHGIFGVPLRQSITYANVAISLIDENGSSYIYGYVPIVVAKCGVFLKEKATEIEGIFRLSGSEKRIKELKTIFDSPDRYGKGLIWEGYTVHDASNVFRRYLNDLPEPVVPLDLYEKFREPLRGATKQGTSGDAEGPQFVENFDEQAAIAQYQKLITELPPLNRQLLLYILDLLAVFAAKSDLNRMNSQNLAAIFQPGMLSHPHHAMAPEEYRLNQCVLIFLIENQDHFLIGMQGTAADEQTRQEVETGSSVGGANAPATPAAQRTSGLGRSASNASAGAESVRRDGMIRRNRSTSSRHSRHEGGATTPGSPALATTPTGGLARSNTVPSKKSPALPSGRFPKDPSPGVSRQMSFTPGPDDLGSTSDRSTMTTAAVGASTLSPGPMTGAGRSQERLLEPPLAEPMSTPMRERNLQSLFQRSPTNDSGRPRNKLKKRIPGSMNQSAQSSTASLAHSAAASPNVEVTNPLEHGEQLHQHPRLDRIPPLAQRNSTGDTSSEPTPRGSHTPSNTLRPENTLKAKKSPPTSLHSSFNEGSDIDHVDEPPPSAALGDLPEKDKKKRWRLSRAAKEESGAHQTPLTSPRRAAIGANSNAETSTTSVASNGKVRKSLAYESSDPALSTMEGQLSHESSMKDKDGKDDPKGPIIGWIRNKYREAKENHEQRRNKSPPAGDNRQQSIGSTSFLPNRGKSMDMKREEEKHAAQVAAATAVPLSPQTTQPQPPLPQQPQEPQEPQASSLNSKPE